MISKIKNLIFLNNNLKIFRNFKLKIKSFKKKKFILTSKNFRSLKIINLKLFNKPQIILLKLINFQFLNHK